MQNRIRAALRQLLPGAAFLAAFAALTVFLFTWRRDERLFENICTKLFREEMASNTLDMHYTIASPEDFGIHSYQAHLPCYSAAGRLRSQAQTENLIAALSALDPARLSDKNRDARSLLLQFLDTSLSMAKYPYFDEPLSPSSGMQSQLPVLLAEYAFRTERDVTDYLKLLDQTDEYFASLLAFEQEKARAGLIMPASSLEKVIEQCGVILDKASLENETHFLQSTFEERLSPLVAQEILPREKAEQYISLNNRLLRTVMRPAYDSLADGLCLLQDDAVLPAGLASHDGGQEYYALLLASETGSSRTIPQIEELLLKRIEEEYDSLQKLLKSDPALLSPDREKEIAEAFPYRSAAQMLADLQQRMQADFPPLSMPSVAVKSVSESLQEYCAPAFYLTPPLDDTSANVIYINEKDPPNGLELYTTLAHEGYPGHMYQSVYYNRLQDHSAASQARQLLWYGGYLEGWALYVEFLSYDYASQLMAEQGQTLSAAAVQLEKHNRSLQLCLSSLLDLLIHYENASPRQAAEVLSSFGIENGAAAAAIYEYIAEEPANYPKYYLGYLEILALREQARAEWGDAYSDYAFHTFFLECGPSDFSFLKEHLKEAAP